MRNILLLVLSITAPCRAQVTVTLDYGLHEATRVEVNGTELTYIEKGEGVPLVLVHGGFSDFRYWESLIEQGATDFRMIALSLRDFFLNTPDADPSSQTPFTDVEDLICFIEELEIAPVHLVGHSHGGHVSLLLSIMRPDIVRSLTLVEGGFISEGAPEAQEALAGFVPLVEQSIAFKQAGETERAVERFIDFVLGPGAFAGAPSSRRQQFLDNAPAFGRRPNAPLSCQDASHVQMPVLLVMGAQSPAHVHALMSGVQTCVPNVTSITIPDASHDVHLANPVEFNKAVLEFVALP
jgi:pimeloyl-ACP methyl ester carboxylesterase